MTIGEKIKTLREQRGISRYELGLKADISPQLVYKYEGGEADNITLKTAEKIARALNVSPVEFLEWKPTRDIDEFAHDVPVYRRVSCAGIPVEDDLCFHVPVGTESPSETFGFMVSELACAIVDRTRESGDGDVVAVSIDGGDICARRYHAGTNGIELSTHESVETFTWSDMANGRVRFFGRVIELRVAL